MVKHYFHATYDTRERLEKYKSLSLFRHQTVIDESLINFSSNDYLCVSHDKRTKKAFKKGVDIYGLGSGSSALISGYTNAHKEAEIQFSEFLNRDHAILFNSGYHANLGVITSLAHKKTHIISDRLCHASLIDGIQLSHAKLLRYPHNDLDHASLLLSQNKANPLLVSESIFSMEGDITPAHKLAALSSRYAATFIIDDAHGIGVLGKNGKGICEYYNLTQEDVPCLIVPLGKALGSMGAIVAGRRDLIESLRQFSRTYIYSTSLPPAIAYATLETLNIIKTESWRREKLKDLILFFLEHANALNLPFISNDITPIKTLIVRDSIHALKIQTDLMYHGFFIACIRWPTVSKNTARIRISLNCLHTKKQILSLLRHLSKSYHAP